MFSDPDGCLDLRHFPITNAGRSFEDCSGPDESFLEFTTERFDTFDRLPGVPGDEDGPATSVAIN